MTIEELYTIYCNYPVISTDSRNISKNCLFFALKGEHFDGNYFAVKAIEDGAAYAIVDNKEVAKSQNCIFVDNVLKILQLLANYHRRKLNIPILAITGTNGKTTTKELIASVLKQKYNTVYTQGNLNNHIGVPLTLLSMNSKTEFGVVEMGANHQFEIKALCEIAEPNFGLITNIGKAHLEGFGSFENIIKTKTELYHFIDDHGGIIFYNGENKILLDNLKSVSCDTVVYGNTNDSYIDGKVISASPFINLEISENKNTYTISTKIIGNYNLENILASVCIGNYFGIESLKIKFAIENYIPSNNRSQLIQSKRNTIFMDAYNANPTSIVASLTNFIGLTLANKCVILGDMLELGVDTAKEHENIIKILKDNSFENVILVGKIYSSLNTPKQFMKFENVEQAITWVEKKQLLNSSILIKGSRGIHLERLVEYL